MSLRMSYPRPYSPVPTALTPPARRPVFLRRAGQALLHTRLDLHERERTSRRRDSILGRPNTVDGEKDCSMRSSTSPCPVRSNVDRPRHAPPQSLVHQHRARSILPADLGLDRKPPRPRSHLGSSLPALARPNLPDHSQLDRPKSAPRHPSTPTPTPPAPPRRRRPTRVQTPALVLAAPPPAPGARAASRPRPHGMAAVRAASLTRSPIAHLQKRFEDLGTRATPPRGCTCEPNLCIVPHRSVIHARGHDGGRLTDASDRSVGSGVDGCLDQRPEEDRVRPRARSTDGGGSGSGWHRRRRESRTRSYVRRRATRQYPVWVAR